MQFCEPTCSIFLFMYVINEGPLTKKASFPNWACRLYPISEITWFRFQCSRKSIEKLKICSVFCSLILKFPAHRMQQKVPKLWNLSKNSMLRKGSEVSRFCTKNYILWTDQIQKQILWENSGLKLFAGSREQDKSISKNVSF